MKLIKFDPFSKNRLELSHTLARPNVQDLLDYFPEIDLWASLDNDFCDRLVRWFHRNQNAKGREVAVVSTRQPIYDLLIPEAEKHSICQMIMVFTNVHPSMVDVLAADYVAIRTCIRMNAIERGLKVNVIPCSIEMVRTMRMARVNYPEVDVPNSNGVARDVKVYIKKCEELRALKNKIRKASDTNEVLVYRSLQYDLHQTHHKLTLNDQMDALEKEVDYLGYFIDSSALVIDKSSTKKFIKSWIIRLIDFLSSRYGIGVHNKLTIESAAIIGHLFCEIGLGRASLNPREAACNQYYRWALRQLE